MKCVRCGVNVLEYNRRDRICDECRSNMASVEKADDDARAKIQALLDKLKRYEEREPLVQALLSDVRLAISKIEDEHTVAGALLVLYSTAERARDFKLE